MSGNISWLAGYHGGSGFVAYYESPWSFEETVGRLITASGQSGDSVEGYKLSMEFTGTYKGKIFTLYDYKEDRAIHIGGDRSLDARGLSHELTDLLRLSEPASYHMAEHYDKRTGYGWPSAQVPSTSGHTYDEDTREVLQQIMQVLGPEATCLCKGCSYETNEAIRLLTTLGIVYQPRKAKVWAEHDQALEERGNDAAKD